MKIDLKKIIKVILIVIVIFLFIIVPQIKFQCFSKAGELLLALIEKYS